jgi:spore coat protein CotH
MNSFAGFLLVSEAVGNIELKHPKSIYMYRDKGSGAKIGMGPLWDFDWAFGNPDQEGKYFQDPQSRVMTQWRTFFKRFYEDPEFKTAYKNLWNDNYSKITGIETFIDEMGTLLAKSQVENAIAINKTTVNYQQQINSMKTWWREHISYLNTEINK